MDVKLPEGIAKAIGERQLRKFGLEEKSFQWAKYEVLNLCHYSLEDVKKLTSLIEPHAGIRGGKILLYDLNTWIKTIEKGHSPKARNVEHFCSIVTQVIARIDGHRAYIKNDVHGNAMLACYVNKVSYTPKYESREGDSHPAYTTIELLYEEFGGRHKKTITFYESDCTHITPEEALVKRGLYLETPEMRNTYLKETERFSEMCENVGKQYLATNVGTDDLDGNKDSRSNRWWHTHVNRILLDKDGIPSRVVVDVFSESDEEAKNERGAHIDSWFWKHSSNISETIVQEIEEKKKEDEEHRERDDLPEEDVEEPPTIEIPIHPFLACFDLKRHLRLRIHVNYLTEYEYNPKLGEKLILPKETTELVDMLVSHKGVFDDIVSGKGGGIVVLCAGPPGTGKTLTAEVYTEVMARPLYSVQCSQLGTDPEELEDELLKVFSRAQRWNAILLLDEADVYVHTRGDNLQQNAIVGVFLRTLEYYNGVLFLTTNRAQDVDDAIASRCVARIEYLIPSVEDQKKIWNVLSETANIELSEIKIDRITERHKDLSGRDIKNLLKLGKMVCETNNTELTVDTIDFVKKFKPTHTEEK